MMDSGLLVSNGLYSFLLQNMPNVEIRKLCELDELQKFKKIHSFNAKCDFEKYYINWLVLLKEVCWKEAVKSVCFYIHSITG